MKTTISVYLEEELLNKVRRKALTQKEKNESLTISKILLVRL